MKRGPSRPRSATVVLLLLWMILAEPSVGQSAGCRAAPFDNVMMIDSDVLTEADPTAFQDMAYDGERNETIYDYRQGGRITTRVFVFVATFSDGFSLRIYVNGEFASRENAESSARMYAADIGRIPGFLRRDVETVYVNKGSDFLRGWTSKILIYTGDAEWLRENGWLEEALLHEAAHASLDTRHKGWADARQQDALYISSYACEYDVANDEKAAGIEDIAESFAAYYIVKHGSDRVGADVVPTIRKTIPHRIEYFESLDSDGKWCPVVAEDCRR